MLTYKEVVIYYNFPLVIFLWWITKPFLTRTDKYKITIVSTVTVIAILLNNCLTDRRNRSYRQNAVTLIGGFGPVEEYFNGGLQIIISSLLTFFITRWTISFKFLKRSSQSQFYFTRYSIELLLALLAILGRTTESSELKSIYGFFLVISCIWFVAGQYITRHLLPIAISIIAPSLYFYYVDNIFVRNQVWYPNKDFSQMAALCYYFVINTVIVFASAAFDKSKAIVDLFYPQEQLVFRVNPDIVNEIKINLKSLLKGLFTNEIELPPFYTEDFKNCVSVSFKGTSSTFTKVVSKFFNRAVFQEFMIIFALLRLVDDIVDSDRSKQEKYEFLSLLERLLNEVFKNHLSDKELLTALSSRADICYDTNHIDWNYYKNKLTAEELSVFRSFSRIAFYMPRKPFDYLIQGFKWDIEGKLVKGENEFLQHAKRMSGSTMTIFIFIFWQKSGNWPKNIENVGHHIIENGGNLGTMIHVLDTSRDIINDSIVGRCCLPTTYFPNDEYKHLVAKHPLHVENKLLMGCCEKLFYLHNQLVDELPTELHLITRDLSFMMLALIDIFRTELQLMRDEGVYGCNRFKLSSFRRYLLLFKWAYFPPELDSLKFKKRL